MVRTNPFPGMNPFLEQRWSDFHSRFITGLGNALNAVLPEDLVARTETDLYVTTDRYERSITPDAFVVETPMNEPAGGSAIAAAVAAPIRVRLRREPVRIHHIEIREPDRDDRIVTAIELFSPTNKLDARGRAKYERKRGEYLVAGVNLVELDLLRGGRHLIYFPAEQLPPAVQKTYKICVVRPMGTDGEEEVDCDLYGADIGEPLPPINVPLRSTDRDAQLNLQGILDDCFQRGKYVDLRYDRDLVPPLDEQEWALVRKLVGR